LVTPPIGEPEVLRLARDQEDDPKDGALSPLSMELEPIHERFGTDLTEKDKLVMVQVVDDLKANEVDRRC
jgi:hypothetical protein